MTASGDSIREGFTGLLFLHSQMGFPSLVSTPLFDSAFTGYKSGLTAFADLVCRQGFHSLKVSLVMDLVLSADAVPFMVVAGALFLGPYLFWFRPVSFVALTVEHVQLLPNNVFDVTT